MTDLGVVVPTKALISYHESFLRSFMKEGLDW